MRKIVTWVAMMVALAGGANGSEAGAEFLRGLTPAERAEAGLDKLSADELAALVRVVERYRGAAETAGSAAEAKPTEGGRQPSWVAALAAVQRLGSKPDAAEPLRARLDGTLRSFEGLRRFTLSNGQVWEMIERGRYAGPSYENPEVIITPGMMGIFWLQIPDGKVRVKVKPVKLE